MTARYQAIERLREWTDGLYTALRARLTQAGGMVSAGNGLVYGSRSTACISIFWDNFDLIRELQESDESKTFAERSRNQP